MNDRFNLSALIQEYRDESIQQLNRLDQALLKIEDAGSLPEEERLELLRVLHTLKGNSGMVGLKIIADQVHALETVFKSGGPGGNQGQLDRLFELSATLRSAVERLGTAEQEAALERAAAIRLGDDTATPRRASAEQPARRNPPDRSEPPDSEASSPSGPIEAPDPGSTDAVSASGTEVIRVPFAKLDLLLADVGELVGLHARLESLLDRHRDQLIGSGLYRELQYEIERLDLAADALRETTTDLRLVPLRTVFGPFAGLVRELARSQGKRAKLLMEGGDIEVDKSAADALSEPLLHLVRNAVDHGIEEPEERNRKGKDEVGQVRLRAIREGDHIQIEVSDNGAGLDRAAILRRAREETDPAEGAEISEDELDQFIFQPGFSTRTEANTVSGRGIGLDIVRRGMLRLRGSLEIDPGVETGTRFVLRLPLTLAIVPALIFESDGEILALPATEVNETLPRSRPERVGGAEVVRQQERLVPVARPGRIFDWVKNGSAAAGPARPQFAIVLHKGGRTAAITADRLLEQRDVVVQALPSYLGTVRGVSGATVAPDGRVILLLDSQGVLDLNMRRHRRPTRAE